MSAEDFASWGADSVRLPTQVSAPAGPRAPEVHATRPAGRSLLRARANAVILDGLILAVPLILIDVLMGALFPHEGFFSTSTDTQASYAFIGPSGGLLMIALWLSYFAISESLTGQTVGKRWMGLRVVSLQGGPAGIAAVSARSVLRLIDDLGFCVVGLIPMLVTGQRRRRFGDLAGRTLVVPVESTTAARPQPGLRAAVYPLIWLTTVMVVVFGVGLGSAAGASDRAIALVRAYDNARVTGNAALACSLLAHDQQRELVALVTRDYRHATAAACPQYVESTTGRSDTIHGRLREYAEGPLVTRPTVGGGVAVLSPAVPELALYAITENGRSVLDARGLQKLSFVDHCATSGGAATCLCIYEWLRAQQINPFASSATGYRARRAFVIDATRCRADPTRSPA